MAPSASAPGGRRRQPQSDPKPSDRAPVGRNVPTVGAGDGGGDGQAEPHGTGAGAGGDVAPKPMTIAASAAYASASTNLDGGDLSLVGGAGASGSAGDADGGHVKIDGGQAYGTGTAGAIYIANTRGQLSFFAATPVSQQATTGTTTGFTAGTGTSANDDSTYTGNSGTAAYTVGDIVLALKNYGLLAAS